MHLNDITQPKDKSLQDIRACFCLFENPQPTCIFVGGLKIGILFQKEFHFPCKHMSSISCSLVSFSFHFDIHLSIQQMALASGVNEKARAFDMMTLHESNLSSR